MVDIHRHRDLSMLSAIPIKANRLLQIILCLVVIISLKLWHLGIIQHEKKAQEAFRARKKVVVEPAMRGTIRDRFNVLLAYNTTAYRVRVIYHHIRQVPAISFVSDESGKKEKRYPRREYIHKLSCALARVLKLDSSRIEDEIHSNAVFYGHIPYLIKDPISEEEYYRLKMMEKDWPGISCQRYPKRHYPHGKAGSHVIGYIGPIPQEKYRSIVDEIKRLELYVKCIEDNLFEDVELPEGITSYGQAKRRLAELQEMAYTIGDDVGLLGSELAFEEELRGFAGKKLYFADAKGNFLRQLPGSHEPLSGRRLYLSISHELQEFAEALLAQSEKDRDILVKKKDKLPWVKGGAIVAMEPNTGEVIALASFPRFDPNDFIAAKKKTIWWQNPALKWLASEKALGAVWDGLIPVMREGYDEKKQKFIVEEMPFTWARFLEWLLPQDSLLQKHLHEETSLGNVIAVQQAFSAISMRLPLMQPHEVMSLIYPESERNESSDDIALFLQDIAKQKAILDTYLLSLPHNQERLTFLDITRLVVNAERIDEQLFPYIQSLTIRQYRELLTSYVTLVEEVRQEVRQLFRASDFAIFRKDHEKEFLQKKRAAEKSEKKTARPYLEYLDKEESVQFDHFWNLWKPYLLEYAIIKKSSLPADEQLALQAYFDVLEGAMDTSLLDDAIARMGEDLCVPFLQLFRPFSDLKEPLYGKYGKLNFLQDMAAAFSYAYGPGYMSSFAYRNPAAQGSIFKIVTAYAALCQRYQEEPQTKHLELFEMVDRVFTQNGKVYVGQFLDGKPIPQLYKGGRVPKSLNRNIGRVDLMRAIETSSDPYFSLLAGDYLQDPDDLRKAATQFGYGEQSKIRLPHEARCTLPSDLKTNKTGLYAFAIGQGAFTATPLQSACMLSAVANGGKLLQPKIEKMLVGKGCYYDKDLVSLPAYPHKEILRSIGIDFPLFLATLPEQEKPTLRAISTDVRREIFLPEVVRARLLQGMQRVLGQLHKDSGRQLATIFSKHPSMKADFANIQDHAVGKTSTSEVKERITPFSPLVLYNHTWFGGISFDKEHSFHFHDAYGRPELVVVVCLRYGGYGKEAAPLAAQVIEKWRSIKARHGGDSVFLDERAAQ